MMNGQRLINKHKLAILANLLRIAKGLDIDIQNIEEIGRQECGRDWEDMKMMWTAIIGFKIDEVESR